MRQDKEIMPAAFGLIHDMDVDTTGMSEDDIRAIEYNERRRCGETNPIVRVIGQVDADKEFQLL